MMNSIVAVDIGNSFVKAGWFADVQANQDLSSDNVWTFQFEQIGNQDWHTILKRCPAETHWLLASVNQTGFQRVRNWLAENGSENQWSQLFSDQLPLKLDGVDMQQVGVDRVLAAIGARAVQTESAPLIVIDLGTAVTVDAVTADGHFLGGVIMPGLAMGAKGLADQTDGLPEIVFGHAVVLPEVIGKTTDQAMEAGLVWGMIGAIETVVRQQMKVLGEATQVFVSGGDVAITPYLAFDSIAVTNLCLKGMAFVAKTGNPT